MNDSSHRSALDREGVRSLIRLALEEDAPYGDFSALCTIAAEHCSKAQVIAREELVFCGAEFVPILIDEFSSGVSFRCLVSDGALVRSSQPILMLAGSTRAILQLERVLLNFLQRLAGVASLTQELVSAAHGITILDTRKTVPGWRVLDKYAVRVGGGKNHRFSLSDMILIKNNHIDAHGGDVAETLRQVAALKPLYMPVEVEVRSLVELEQVIPFSPTAVLLDNMTNQQISECLALLREKAPQISAEVSGGITKERLAQLAKIGVSVVSVGSLTTVARQRDISLRIEK